MGGSQPARGAEIATRADIVQVLLLMQAAFPNYHPEPVMLDVLLQFLQDLPGDVLKVAVLDTCAQSGRAFAPAVGEIRAAAARLSARVQAIPNEFEAWEEMRLMPPNMLHSMTQEERTQAGLAEFDQHGRLLIYQTARQWSHPLVEKVARQLGWPDFPGENESVDRAHFYQAYRAELNRMMEIEGELPVVRKYIELHRDRPDRSLQISQALKDLPNLL